MLLIGPSAKDALLRPTLNNFLVISEKNWLLDRSLDYLPVLLVHVDNLVLWCFWCIFSGSLQHFSNFVPLLQWTIKSKRNCLSQLSIFPKMEVSKPHLFCKESLIGVSKKLNSFLSTPYMFSTIYKVPVNNFLMQST